MSMNGLALADPMNGPAALTPAELEDFRAWRRAHRIADDPARQERRLTAARKLATLPVGSDGREAEQDCRDNAPPWQQPAASLARAAKAAPIEVPRSPASRVSDGDLELPLLAGGPFKMAPMVRELQDGYQHLDVRRELKGLVDWVKENKSDRAPGSRTPGNETRPEPLIIYWLDRATVRAAPGMRVLRAERAERIARALALIETVHLQPKPEPALATRVREALEAIPVPREAINEVLSGS